MTWVIAAAAGYPNEPLIFIHPHVDKSTAEGFVSVIPKRRAAPLIFELENGPKHPRLTVVGHTAVDRATFVEQFRLFTVGAFERFKEEDWSNILVAGGAVLASVLPLEARWPQMSPRGENVYFTTFNKESAFEPRRTLASFFKDVRWPGADVDLFIHGLDEAAANLKTMHLIALITQTFKAQGASEIVYVKTPNTATIDPGTTK